MAIAKILIIESNHSLNLALASSLVEKGFDVSKCFDGEAGLLEAAGGTYDLVLLSTQLSKLSGLALLASLRKTCDTPVLMLTAPGADNEVIQGLRLGADDCIAKPIQFEEVSLRVDAILRRVGCAQRGMECDKRSLVVRDLAIDKKAQSATVGQQVLNFTPIQFKLLWMLAVHRGEVLTKSYLYKMVLKRDFSIYDRSLDMHLSRVRRKLTSAGLANDRLQTVHGKGYVLT